MAEWIPRAPHLESGVEPPEFRCGKEDILSNYNQLGI